MTATAPNVRSAGSADRFYHVTLNSGHGLWQEAQSVRERQETIASLGRMMDQGTGGEDVPVDGVPGYLAWFQFAGATMVSELRTSGPGDLLLTVAACFEPEEGLPAWRALHQDRSEEELETYTDGWPQVPWLAERREAAWLRHPDAFGWASDYARCLGWAWWQRTRGLPDDRDEDLRRIV